MGQKAARYYATDAPSMETIKNRLERTSSGYQVLPSVWEGEDGDLLELMLDFYPRKHPQYILDVTMNVGRFWRGSSRPVIGLDINPRYRPTIVGDNLRLPFHNECVDVIVYDPPHIPNQGKDRSKDFNTRFGLVLKSSAENGYNFSHLYRLFVCEAYRVLRSEGILFCNSLVVFWFIAGHPSCR